MLLSIYHHFDNADKSMQIYFTGIITKLVHYAIDSVNLNTIDIKKLLSALKI